MLKNRLILIQLKAHLHKVTQKHGIEAYGRIWQESTFPEDPIQAYARLFCAGDMEKFYDERSPVRDSKNAEIS